MNEQAARARHGGRTMEKQMTKTSKLLAATFAGALAFGTAGSALASSQYPQGYQSSFSTIKSLGGGSVTLANGKTFNVPYGYDMSKLKVGERVAITWLDENGTYNAATIVAG